MGDANISDPSTPLLLSHKDPIKDHHINRHKNHRPATLDDRIEQCIGDFGWSQLFQSVLVSLSWAFDAQQCFISVFTDSLSSPSNTISDWSLAGAGPFLAGLPASTFFIGCVAGSILLSTLADSCLGRKNLLLLSCLTMSLSGIATALFATNIYLYSALRFVCGFGRASIGTCALVLCSELVGHRWRSHIGIMGFIFFSLGFATLPGIAYLGRDQSWRQVYLWTSIPALVYSLAVHFFVKESPRWLFVRGRKEEAVRTLKYIAADREGSVILNSFDFDLGSDALPDEGKCIQNVNVYSAMRILVSSKWSCRRLILVMVIAFGLGVVYYGMPLGLGNLSFNLYLSVGMSALSELPASLVAFLLIGRLNRKPSMLVTTAASGACSVMVGMVGRAPGSPMLKTVQVALELVSFLSGTTALDLILIYTTELFPTCVRNSALSLARQALVFGGVFGPVLAAAGRDDELITYGVFGVVILVCGVFVVWLPETRGTVMCDTMEEEECKERERKAGLVV